MTNSVAMARIHLILLSHCPIRQFQSTLISRFHSRVKSVQFSESESSTCSAQLRLTATSSPFSSTSLTSTAKSCPAESFLQIHTLHITRWCRTSETYIVYINICNNHGFIAVVPLKRAQWGRRNKIFAVVQFGQDKNSMWRHSQLI